MDRDALQRLIEAVETGSSQYSGDTIRKALGSNAHISRFIDAKRGDLNEAKALHEALLPGWDWSMHGNGQAFLWPPGTIDEQNLGCIEVDIEDQPARALLVAILRALLDKGEA